MKKIVLVLSLVMALSGCDLLDQVTVKNETGADITVCDSRVCDGGFVWVSSSIANEIKDDFVEYTFKNGTLTVYESYATVTISVIIEE